MNTIHTCGTAHCIAGITAALEKMEPSVFNGQWDWSSVRESKDYPYVRVHIWAQERLGLEQSEAFRLFAEDWLPDEIEDWAGDAKAYRSAVALDTATAMERLADGWSIDAVSGPPDEDEEGYTG